MNDIVEQIRILPCFLEVAYIRPLAGGLTNQVFKVSDSTGVFVVRLCKDIEILGIDRRAEMSCLTSAASIGVAPELFYREISGTVRNTFARAVDS